MSVTRRVNESKILNQKGVDDLVNVEVLDIGERMSLKHCFISGDQVYHITLIDFLQKWNLNKKSERFMKVYMLSKDGPTLSAIEPASYAARFKQFCQKHVFGLS